jgi:cytochrome d ubiquinol oxidase subunit I
VGLGFLMVALAFAAWLFARKFPSKWLKAMRWLTFGTLLPYLANTAGWLLTENARQPWIVTGLMKTADAVSPSLTTTSVLISLIGFIAIYTLLMAMDVFLLVRTARKGLDAAQLDSVPVDEPKLVQAEGGK